MIGRYDEFLTPRASMLQLHASDNTSRVQTVRLGDPLLVTARLPGGLVQVHFAGRRWLASETTLQPWGDAPVQPIRPAAYGALRDPRFATPTALAGRLVFLLAGLAVVASPFPNWVGGSNLLDLALLGSVPDLLIAVLVTGMAAVLGAAMRLSGGVSLKVVRIWGCICGTLCLLEVMAVLFLVRKLEPASSLMEMRAGFYLLMIASAACIGSTFLDG